LKKVFVLLLILGTMLGASAALAKQQPASSGSDHSFGHGRAIEEGAVVAPEPVDLAGR